MTKAQSGIEPVLDLVLEYVDPVLEKNLSRIKVGIRAKLIKVLSWVRKRILFKAQFRVG